MLSVLLFGVHTLVLIFGMGASMLPYYRYFFILFFVISAPLWLRCTDVIVFISALVLIVGIRTLMLIVGISTLVLIVEKTH